MTETTNLHLTKDARNDHYSVDRVNANSDRIDGFAGETAAALSDLDERVEALEEGGVPADAYTKAETDTLLAAKANQSDLSSLAATVAGKQDEISDLAAIRSGASAGATAVQTIKINGTTQTKTNGTVNLPAYPTTLPASDTVSTYSPSGTAPVNGTAVKASMTGTLDSTDSNHSATSKAVADSQAEQDAEIAVIANAGAKSLLPIGVSNTTYANAVTFSIAHDGVITVNGTNPNGYAGIPYADLVAAKSSQLETRYTLPAGKYKITSTGDGLKFQVHCHDGTNAYALFSGKSGGEFEYTSALKTQYPYICWRLAIDANASFSNQIVKPMIWNAEIKDSTFQPYAPTNRELYEMILALQNGGA